MLNGNYVLQFFLENAILSHIVNLIIKFGCLNTSNLNVSSIYYFIGYPK